MCNPSITHLPRSDHNVPETPLTICACPCLRCGGPYLGWDEPVILCPTCGAEWTLTRAQADEFALALLGINGLSLTHFLQAIDQEGGAAPPPSVPYSALVPTWHVTARFPSHALAEVAA